jgi:hypothetical protein
MFQTFVDGVVAIAARNAFAASDVDSDAEKQAVVVLAQYNLTYPDRQVSPKCTTAILERLNGDYLAR